VPSYDLRTLWVLDNSGNALIPIDPRTSKPGARVPVTDPYNLYFTPDGAEAMVVAEQLHRLDFRDPHTMALHSSLDLPCPGLNHMDFTTDGRFLVATCEFGGKLVKVDLVNRKLVGEIDLGGGAGRSMPQDVRISPDGSTFYVADMMANGVWIIDASSFKTTGFIPTGPGAHGLYPSRDGTKLYVSNRGSSSMSRHPPHGPGSVSVIDFATRKVEANWPIPGGGSPDMGNVTADGSELWLSGRFDSEVYVFNTMTGALDARIRVGSGPHGLTVWPQPGRYSLGHTGNMR
jgi:DNA-binding beta-propeller fold protein YncE